MAKNVVGEGRNILFYFLQSFGSGYGLDRIEWGLWISIRIRILKPDPDPGEQKMTQKHSIF